MSVEIRSLDIDEDADRWDEYVERYVDNNPFFRSEALRLQAEFTQTTPYLLAGFKGEELVGLFPMFEYTKGPLSLAFSPAPYSWSTPLGPALTNLDKLKRRKRDRRTRRFVHGSLDWIDTNLSPMYYKFDSGQLEDVRPFIWRDFSIWPEYSYVVHLDHDPDTLIGSFSADARNNIGSGEETRYEIEVGDEASVETIVSQVSRRYDSQDRPFHLSGGFARALYEDLPEGSVLPYVCRVDGEVVGGIIVLQSDSTRYRWLGGVKPPESIDVPVNDLLDWRVMIDGIETGIDRYDLVGAGVRSINKYKSKFNPELSVHYTVTDGSYGIHHLIEQYRKVR